MAMEPFEIKVLEEQISDLRRRVASVRLLPAPVGDAWVSGVDYTELRRLADYWTSEYEWRTHEAVLNVYEHYLTDVEGQTIHFLLARADRNRYPGALPIVLSHGWPYSFIEFLPIIPWLIDPLAHGGEVSEAFDVVVPSLPGYGFSAPLSGQPFTGESVARLWHRLMTDVLGFDRFASYGEDVGTWVSDWLGALYPETVVGIFSTHAAFPPDERRQDLSEEEQRFLAWLAEKWRTGRGYSEIQSTRPDTLAVALGDSPVGLLAWLLEKFHEWSGPGFASAWTVDDILTTVSLYWFTGTIGTSFVPYYDVDKPLPVVSVPVGVAVQWRERGFPRSYAARTYSDIRTWTELPRGGHFTAKQDPDLVATAMRSFFRSLNT